MSSYLIHHGIKGQKWGVRQYQNPDGSLTEEGRMRYGRGARLGSRTTDVMNRNSSTEWLLNETEKSKKEEKKDWKNAAIATIPISARAISLASSVVNAGLAPSLAATALLTNPIVLASGVLSVGYAVSASILREKRKGYVTELERREKDFSESNGDDNE